MPTAAAHVPKRTALAAALLVACVAPLSGWLWPQFNWDMLAYIGIAHSWSVADPPAAHTAAYFDASRFADMHGLQRAFDQLAHGTPYRQLLATDAGAFGEVLRFYKLRPLYEAAVVALGWAGVNLAAATIIVSCLAVLAANVAVLWFAVRAVGVWPGVALFAGFALSPPIMTVAGYSTADALGTAFVTFGAIAWLAGRPVLGAAILLTSVAVRTDFALTNLIVAGVFGALRVTGAERVPAASLALLALSYPLARAIEAAGGAYPFSVLYYNTFVTFLPHPAHPGPIVVPPRRYVTALCAGLANGLANGAYAWPLVPAIALSVRARWSPAAIFAAAFLLAFVVRVIIFPEPDVRLVAPIFAVIYLAFIGWEPKQQRAERQAVLF